MTSLWAGQPDNCVFLFLQMTSYCVFELEESKLISIKQDNIYLFNFMWATCLGQPTIIRPALHNSEQGALLCKIVLCNMGSHRAYKICL